MDGQTMKNNERAKNPATTKQVAVTTATLIKQASYIMGWREIHAGAPKSSWPAALLDSVAPTKCRRRQGVLGSGKFPWLWRALEQQCRASEASGLCARHIRPRLCRASDVAFLYGLV
jgi:hypothetical protein